MANLNRSCLTIGRWHHALTRGFAGRRIHTLGALKSRRWRSVVKCDFGGCESNGETLRR